VAQTRKGSKCWIEKENITLEMWHQAIEQTDTTVSEETDDSLFRILVIILILFVTPVPSQPPLKYECSLWIIKMINIATMQMFLC
jgi:hypothetical protein